MKPRAHKFNPKRRILPRARAEALREQLCTLADRVRYGGNAEHKRSPGDFGLSPPALPRVGKSLCDDAGIFKRAEAERLLKTGLASGLVSDRFEGEWPFNVWAVTQDGAPLEAQWEGAGVYHGYPMPEDDPLRPFVLKRWSELQ